ncbi:MAG TPA: tape measure protein [Pyrinomonadaceae bacterium]
MGATYEYKVIIRSVLDATGVREGAKGVNSALETLDKQVIEHARSINDALKNMGGARLGDTQVKGSQRVAQEVQRINEQTRRQAEQQARFREQIAERTARAEITAEQRKSRVVRELLQQELRERQKAAQSASTGNSFLNRAGAVAAGGLAAIGIVSITNELVDGARAWLNYSAKIEQSKIAFTTMLGSAQAAESHLKELQDFAKKTPFEFPELIDASQRMQALGFTAKEVVPLLTDVGNAVAAAGGGGERLERVIKAISDIRSKGKVETQEIRQLAESGISAFQILEKHLGKSRAELVKMVEAGDISSEQFLDAFRKFSQANFGGLMEQQSRTFLGALSNIKDGLLQASGTAFKPLFDKISEIAVRFADQLNGANGIEDIVNASADFFGEIGSQIARGIIKGMGEELENFEPKQVNAAPFFRMGEKFAEGTIDGYNDVMRSWVSGDRRASVLKFNRFAGATAGATGGRPKGDATAMTAGFADKANQKAFEKTKDIVLELSRQLDNYGDKSQVAAARQKLLAAGVKDLNSGLAAQAIAIAHVIDKTAEYIEQQSAEQKRQFESTQDIGKDLSSLSEQTLERVKDLVGELKGGRTELEKFKESLLFYSAKDRPEFAATLAGVVEGLKNLDDAIARSKAAEKAKKDAKEVEDAHTKMSESILASATDLNRDLFRQLDNLATFDWRDRTPLDELLQNFEDIKEFRMQPGGFDPILQFLREMKGFDEQGITQRIIGLLSGKDIEPEKLAAAAIAMTEAIRRAVELGEKLNPVEIERRDLTKEIDAIQKEIANGPYNESLRIQLAYLEDIAEMRGRDEKAIMAQNRAMLELADSTVYHAERANAGVLEFLASQRSVTDVIKDAKIGVIQSTYDLIDSGLDRITRKLGIVGDVIKDLTSGFARLALNKFFMSVFGLNSGGGEVAFSHGSQGGGFSLGNILGGIFGGGRNTTTPPFAGGSIPGVNFGAMGGGIGIPTSGTQQAANANWIQAVLQQSGAQGVGPLAQQGSAAGLGGTFGGASAFALPLLGGVLGAQLGGGSRLGQVLGLAGGATLGLIGSGMLMAGTMALSTLGLVAGPLAVAAIAGAIILSKNKQRQEEEKKRNQLSQDTLTQVYEILWAAKRGELTVSEARARWNQIESQYMAQARQLKDSKTRRHAELWWKNDVTPIWSQIEAAAIQGEKAKDFSSRFIPTFADGGSAHRAFSSMLGSGYKRLPDFYAGRVPGRYDRRDDKLIRVSGDEVILKPDDWMPITPYLKDRQVPGFADGGSPSYMIAPVGSRVIPKAQAMANGGTVGSTDSMQLAPVVVNVTNYIDGLTGVVKTVLNSPEGRDIIAGQVISHVETTREDGLLGTLDRTKRRG